MKVREADDEYERWGGRVLRRIHWHIDEDTMRRVREKRVCLNCMEPLDPADPEECPLCRFPVRRLQLQWLTREHRGSTSRRILGSSIDLDEELDRLDDEAERDRWQEHPVTGLVIPRSIP